MYSRIALGSLSIPYCVAGEKKFLGLTILKTKLSGAVVGRRVYIAPKREEVIQYRLTENQRERKSLLTRVSFYFTCFISIDFQGVFEGSNCVLKIFTININQCWC